MESISIQFLIRKSSNSAKCRIFSQLPIDIRLSFLVIINHQQKENLGKPIKL